MSSAYSGKVGMRPKAQCQGARKELFLSIPQNEVHRKYLKVHTSNYRIVGFTDTVGIDELIPIAKEHDIPAVSYTHLTIRSPLFLKNKSSSFFVYVILLSYHTQTITHKRTAMLMLSCFRCV